MAENDPILAGMLAKVSAWQAAVDSYRAAKALEQGRDIDTLTSRGPVELPVNAFRGMTIGEAAKLYLQSVRRKQTTQEIADGLRSGGLESTAKNFGPTLRSILNKMKDKGDLLRFKDGWDLAEAHSASLRNRLAKEAAKPTKKGRTNRKSGNDTKKAAKPKETKPSGPKGPSPDARILAFVTAKPMEWFTGKEIADALRVTDMRGMGLAFARLVRYGRIAKGGDGRYAAVRK